MMKIYKKLILLFLLPLLVCFLDAGMAAADKNALIKNIFEAYGGEGNLKRIKSIIIDSRVKNLYKKAEGTRRVYIKYPDRLRVETKFKGSRDILIYNNDRGWKSIIGDFIEVKGSFLDTMIFSAKTINPPYELLLEENRIIYLGKHKRYDKIYEVLEVSDRKNKGLTFYIDPQSFFIKRAKTTIELEGKKTELEKAFTDFKKIDGILYPYSAVNFTNGLKTIQTDIKEIALNPHIGDELFNP